MSDNKRERRSAEIFETQETTSAKEMPRFDFSSGAGQKLSTLSSWVTGNRGSDAEFLEQALEPLHRAIYGRPGKAGSRRAALSDYCGFPEDQLAVMKSKITVWKKEQLKDLNQALGMKLFVSVSVADLAEGVLKFLRCPAEPKKATTRARSSDPTCEAAPAAKKVRTETAANDATETKCTKKPVDKAPPKSIKAPSSASTAVVSDDTIRVLVYRRVLALTPEERASLSLKDLRHTIAESVGLDDEKMKLHSALVKETALECTTALNLAVAATAAPAQEAARSSETVENADDCDAVPSEPTGEATGESL